MHVTCAGKSVEALKSLLCDARDAGVRNVLALTGEQADISISPSLTATDLLQLIKTDFASDFTVAAGVYPDGWQCPGSAGSAPNSDMATEVSAAKAKQDAGADFLMCQFCFSAKQYETFSTACRAAGVTAPILPGVLAVDQPGTVLRMTEHCHVPLPTELDAALQKVPEEAQGQPHSALQAQLCATAAALLGGGAPGLHFYLLNLQSALLHALRSDAVGKALAARGGLAVHRRKLPWRASAVPERESEAVRPIFWANRSKSYIQRTAAWQEYPTGRWADVAEARGMPALAVGSAAAALQLTDTGHTAVAMPRSISAGDLKASSDSDGVIVSELGSWGDAADRRVMWGERLENEQSVWDVFVGYLAGAVPRIPWCEVEMHPETGALSDNLQCINRQGLLTINSQPQVSGEGSDHPVHGWGGEGGVVYQKAYVEFFARPGVVSAIMAVASREAFRSIRYMAVDSKGNTYANGKPGGATAVTWGVFPGREVVQPTVVDPEAFHVWREEAFGLWRQVWADAYDEESPSYALLHDMANKYFLINIVENDYVKGDIWKFIHEVLVQLGGDGLPSMSKSASPATATVTP